MADPKRPRQAVFFLSLGVALFLLVFALVTIPGWYLRIVRLTEWYALAALSFLYITLLISPFCFTFKKFPYRVQLFGARRALGLSAFGLAVIHGSFAFFGQLGGFSGLAFLAGAYVPAVILGFFIFLILSVLAATASDNAQKIIGFRPWKRLHRFIYLAGILLVAHVLVIGTHFRKLNDPVPIVVFLALSFLLVIEAIRFDSWIMRRHRRHARFGPAVILVAISIAVYAVWLVSRLVSQ